MDGRGLFGFTQFEVAGPVGLEPGRYLARDPDRVLVVGLADPPPSPPRRLRRRRPRAVDSRSQARSPKPPVATLTAIRAEPFADLEAAEAWIETVAAGDDAAQAEIDDAVRLANLAIHAARAATLDAHRPDLDPDHALAVRVGFGRGDELVDQRWSRALEIPQGERRRRAEVLRPQERVAAVLAGREQIPACELLVLRARADLDAGRAREAALQARIAVAALLAERGFYSAAGQEDDLATLEAGREALASAARRALEAPGEAKADPEVARMVALSERVLRRQRARG